MGISEAPQWLISAFVRSAEAVGATAEKETLREHCLNLVERWSAPERIFHNLDHLINTLAALDEIISASHDPEMLRLAAWYHGAVFSTDANSAYAGDAGEVMTPSADFARTNLVALGIPTERVDRIAQLILGLGRHSTTDDDTDAKVLIDAELSMLAASPQDYKKYREAIAEEYAHIPRARFLAGRKMIITHLLERRSLFISPLGTQWEKPARENLEAELAKVNTQLENLTPEDLLQLETPLHLHTSSLEKPLDLSESSETNQPAENADENTATPSADKTASLAVDENGGTSLEDSPTLIREIEESETVTGKIPTVELAPLGISDPGKIVDNLEVEQLASHLDHHAEEASELPIHEAETGEAEANRRADDEAARESDDQAARGSDRGSDKTPLTKDREYIDDLDADDEEESDLLATISSTLEFADDCLDTAEMRAIKEARRKGCIVPKMTNPDIEK